MDYHFLFVSYQERIPSTKSVRDEFTMLFLDGNTISNFSFFLRLKFAKAPHISRGAGNSLHSVTNVLKRNGWGFEFVPPSKRLALWNTL